MKERSSAAAPEEPNLWTRFGRLLLGALLVATAIGALTFDRSSWPEFVGDEATYLMAAESLAWDLDLRYERSDYDRFLARWERRPEGVILQSGDQGETLTFGKPFFYSLWLAPFVRLFPEQGAFLGNFVLLLIAALAASRGLALRLGAATSSYVAALLFGSVAFASVFWIHIDLFLMACTALGLALALDEDESADEEERPSGMRCTLGGVLLAMVAFSRPFYAALWLPVALLALRRRRVRPLALSLAGGLALVVAAALVHQALAGSWTSYGGERHGFYGYTGFPEVDFPASDWERVVEEWGNAAWQGTLTLFVEQSATSLSLWRHNLLYFLLGRHVGVLPYFLPLVLVFSGRGGGSRRRWLLAAVALGSIAFLLSRPFNFYGGGAAIANRYFLPLYPALWFALPRGGRARWALASMLLAAPFLSALWLAPRAYPLDERATPAYVTELAKRSLPYETTLNHLKPSGREDVIHHKLWIKFLTPSTGAAEEGLLFAERGQVAELLVGSPVPLAGLVIEAPPGAPLPVVAHRDAVSESSRLFVELEHPTARHPMWWTWDDFFLYHLELRFEGDGVARYALRAATEGTPTR